jgi:hypothetical protein
MKTKLLMGLMALFALSNLAYGSELKMSNYSGPSPVIVKYKDGGHSYYTPVYKVPTLSLTAKVLETDNGRMTLRLNFPAAYTCVGYSQLMYGEEDGFGQYALYLSKEDWMNGKAIGVAAFYDQSLEINLTMGISAETTATNGFGCTYEVSKNFYASLKK